MATDRTTRKWVRGPADEHAVDQGCRFDLKAAERVRRFFAKFLRHSKGRWAGEPFELLDWQWGDLVGPLFGWKRPDGTRRFRVAYVEIPKKNGKSTLASAVGLYLLVGDGERGAEVYSAGTDRNQASIVHDEAVNMVESSPGLSSILEINRTTKTILFRQTSSYYRALPGDVRSNEGWNAHAIICDEKHAWRGRKLHDALRWAGSSRSQPLNFTITTAGDDVHSVCFEDHEYALGVTRGEIQDLRCFGYVRAADPEDDHTSEEVWHKANPSLGHTIDLGEFRADFEEAQRKPAQLSAWKRYRLNLWSTGVSPWLRAADWDACRREWDQAELLGRECYGGLDLSKTRDFTALVLLYPWPEDGPEACRLLPFYWLPEAVVSDPGSPEQYRVWRDRGFLETTPGDVLDYAFVREKFGGITRDYDLKELAYDPWNAEHLTQELEDLYGVRRVLFRQTVGNYAEPCEEFERLVLSGEVHHDGHPILAWNAGNVSVRQDPNGNKRPVKPPEGDPRKIDGIPCAVMALARKMEGGATAYDGRGIMTVDGEDLSEGDEERADPLAAWGSWGDDEDDW